MSASFTLSNPNNWESSLQVLGQQALLARIKQSSEGNRQALIRQLSSLDWAAIATLLKSPQKSSEISSSGNLEPVESVENPSQMALQAGEELLGLGKVAAFTVAGGQGSRLGYEGPKGCFGATPVTKTPLFGVFAQKILAAQKRYGREIPWVLMTSPQNNSATIDFFRQNNFFGLKESQFYFFIQGMLPAIDAQSGQLLLESEASLALSPDGHGGSIKGLFRSGVLDALLEKGISTLSYFQVDNPLVKVIDPLFIGQHRLFGSEFSSKTLPKRSASEKVGVFARAGGALKVVEYSDLPPALAQATDSKGQLLFIEGNIAIHLLELDFVRRIAQNASMPYHRAHKKVPYLSPEGQRVEPQAPNAIKFEQFVFDAIALAQNPLLMRTRREEEFSPIKNAEGEDSPATCSSDQLRLWASWAKNSGLTLPTDPTGLPSFAFEISPVYADNQEAFLARRKTDQTPIGPGTVLA